MKTLLLILTLIGVSGCSSEMRYTKEGTIPGDFGYDFYACREKSQFSEFKQVYTISEKDFFTYQSPNISLVLMGTCLQEKGWERIK